MTEVKGAGYVLFSDFLQPCLASQDWTEALGGSMALVGEEYQGNLEETNVARERTEWSLSCGRGKKAKLLSLVIIEHAQLQKR